MTMNFSINNFLITNTSNFSSCIQAQTFQTLNAFFVCYQLLFEVKLTTSVLGIVLFTLVFLFNLAVIVRILRQKRNNNQHLQEIYNKILLWLCLSYILTDIVDFPFFLIEYLFDYWPLGNASSMIWAIYDNNTSTFVSLLMFYMTYARMRSVQSPITYLQEKILKNPHLMILTFWTIGIFFWTITIIVFGTYEYTSHVAYWPHFTQFILNFLLWFMPLFGVYFIGVHIFIRLHRFQKHKNELKINATQKNLVGMIIDAKSKFTILIVVFLAQWTLPCVFMLIESFLSARVDAILIAFKWTTYTVSLTDPILIWIFIL